MTIVSSATKPTTLSVIKRAGADSSNADDSDSPTVLAAGTKRVNASTTVTTMVLTSGESTLPNLSLEDVLERSGVDDTSEIILEIDSGLQAGEITGSSVSADKIPQTMEQLQAVVEDIESSEAVVVEVETTNNVQTVTVRATDIEAAYAEASIEPPGQPISGLSNFLLLKNGWAYTALTSSPLELTVGPADEQSGNGWALWRSVDNGIHEIQDAATGLWNRLTGQVVDTSPKTPTDVSGAYQTSSVNDQLLSTATTWNSLQLSSDGVFTTTRRTLASSGLLMQDVSYITETVESMSGRSVSFSGMANSGNGSASTGLASESLGKIAGDMFGSFRILEDGMTIELSFADGTSERRLFMRTDSNEVIVDNKTYGRMGDAMGNLLEALVERLTRSGIKGGRKGALDMIGNVVEAVNRQQARKGAAPATGSQSAS